jgi:hypothetical protein
MDPNIIELFEPVVVFGTLLGVAFGVKILIWGKGPIKGHRRQAAAGLEDRVAELEDRLEQAGLLISEQADRVEDLDDRLEFTERVLSRIDQPPALDKPDIATPA